MSNVDSTDDSTNDLEESKSLSLAERLVLPPQREEPPDSDVRLILAGLIPAVAILALAWLGFIPFVVFGGPLVLGISLVVAIVLSDDSGLLTGFVLGLIYIVTIIISWSMALIGLIV